MGEFVDLGLFKTAKTESVTVHRGLGKSAHSTSDSPQSDSGTSDARARKRPSPRPFRQA